MHHRRLQRAGKSTLVRKLLPRIGIERFLNADLIAKGLSPMNPTLAAFAAGRRLLDEARNLIGAGGSFAIESTLSGKTYVKLLREAKERGYRIMLHYIRIDSAAQAVQRVCLRVLTGGHHVPEDDIRRRYERSLRHFVAPSSMSRRSSTLRRARPCWRPAAWPRKRCSTPTPAWASRSRRR